MATFRTVRRASEFVTLDKTCIYDADLSYKAKGILLYLLSRPDDWTIYTKEIEKHSTDGKDSVSSGVNELIDRGYIIRNQVRENGKFKGYEYTVYERPFTETGISGIGEAEIGKTDYGKPATTNNDSTNNKQTNNDDIKDMSENEFSNAHVFKKQFEEWWDLYNKKTGKKNCEPKFKKCVKQDGFEKIMSGTRKYLSTVKEKTYQKNPLTFLNGEHYNDEFETVVNDGQHVGEDEYFDIDKYEMPF